MKENAVSSATTLIAGVIALKSELHIVKIE